MPTLVSHNAFWFQGVPYDGTSPDGVCNAVFDAMVDLYRELCPDLLCVQEVHDPGVAQRIADLLGMHCHHTPGCREPAYGGAVFWRPTTEARVRDYRTDNTLTPHRNWQRITWCIGQQVVRLTHLHLPSSRSTAGDSVDRVQRDEIERFLLTKDFKSDMALGDFNAQPDAPHVQLLRQHGYHDAAALCGQHGQPTCTAGNRIDHVWVSGMMKGAGLQYRVVDLDANCYVPADEHKTRLSDHQPLVVTFREEMHGAI